jgi:hypothetical protein
MSGVPQILPGTGRGTSRRLVEGARLFAELTPSFPRRTAPNLGPLHHAASRRGPPPRPGEERGELQ